MRTASRLLVLALLAACAPRAATNTSPGATPAAATLAPPPAPPREFRGVWIATVGNIDWPTREARGDSARMKDELRGLLDRAQAAGMNAVILQVRSAADALYASRLEPWAGLLTGTPGTDPGFDPLSFAVSEAHARGLELHAWFNPFRAGSARDSLAFPASHVFRARRDLVRVYGSVLWMDPGIPEVAERTLAAIGDVARRYDIDGVHIDDFFYPYPVQDSTRRTLPFPDSASFAANNPRNLTRGDWRRDNVNRFVERMYAEVHRAKPWLKVGISPFGIWRPDNPPGIRGLDAYDALAADARLWLQRGWLDYLAPQLYWAIDPPAQRFTALLDWWTAPEQNPLGRSVWPGLASYRVDSTAFGPETVVPLPGTDTLTSYRPGEILRQVRETRARAERRATGVAFYNATSILTRAGGALGARVRDSLFAGPALVPAAEWLGETAPARPTIVGVDSAAGAAGARMWRVRLAPGAGEAPRWWVVSWRVNGRWTPPARVWGPARQAIAEAPNASARLSGVAAWGVSRTGVLGPAATRALR